MGLQAHEIDDMDEQQVEVAQAIVTLGEDIGLSPSEIVVALQIANIESAFLRNASSQSGVWGPYQYKSDGPQMPLDDDGVPLRDSWEVGWLRLENRIGQHPFEIPAGVDSSTARFDFQWQIKVFLVEFKYFFLRELDEGDLFSATSRNYLRIEELVASENLQVLPQNLALYSYLRHNTSSGETAAAIRAGYFGDDLELGFSQLYDDLGSPESWYFGREHVQSVYEICYNPSLNFCPTPSLPADTLEEIDAGSFDSDILNRFFEWLSFEQATEQSLRSFQSDMIAQEQSEWDWVSISTFASNDIEFFGVSFGSGTDHSVLMGNQITLISSENVSFVGSQYDDSFYFLGLGSNIFGAAGTDTVSFELLGFGIFVSSGGTVQNINGNGLTTDLSRVENITGTEFGDFLEGRTSDNTLIGLAGDDEILGLDGDDRLEGGNGDDTLRGGDDDDRLYGDAGNDLLYGNNDDDRLYGGDGRDDLYGGSGDDDLFGQDGEDNLFGGSGNDNLIGGDDDDHLEGGNGHDELSGGSGNDTLLGEDGDDDLNGGSGNDNLDGGEDDDELSGGSGDDELLGRSGDDTLEGGDGDDRLIGDSGDDYLDGGSGTNTVSGGSGDDLIIVNDDEQGSYFTGGDGFDHLDLSRVSSGIVMERNGNETQRMNFVVDGVTIGSTRDRFEQFTFTDFDDYIRYTRDVGAEWRLGDGNDDISTGDGIDIVYGEGGNDIIETGDDDDEIYGGSGDDTIDGENGDDRIVLGLGDDTAYGGNGDDTFDASFGRNEIDGGTGFDTVEFGSATSAISGSGRKVRFDHSLDGTDFDDRDIEAIVATNFDDRLELNYSLIEAHGGAGDDVIFSDGNAVTIYGDAGNDTLTGHDLDDTILGGSGKDILDGKGGTNSLTGGEGADVFVFSTSQSNTTIHDFEAGTDRLDLNYFLGDAGIASINFGDFAITRINDFGSFTYDSVRITLEQVGEDIRLYASIASMSRLDTGSINFATLEDANLTDISLSDFVW